MLRFIRNLIKRAIKSGNDWEIASNICNKSALENKAFYFKSLEATYKTNRELEKEKKLYYIQQDFYLRYYLRKFLNKVRGADISNTYLNALRWVFVDLIVGKERRDFGIYQFIALPGEGKTMSMVAHMERYREEKAKKGLIQGKDYAIATNFHYVNQDVAIEHWTDIVKFSKQCFNKNIPCLVAMDEIHVTWDSTEFKDFPPEMQAVLSFNRKYRLQFLCSAQIYERIPKKIRDIANFTVVCKNVFHLDRLFRNYYYEKNAYEKDIGSALEGGKGRKKKKMYSYIKDFCADDNFYELYNTREQVNRMVKDSKSEKNAKLEAFNVLFGAVEE